MKKKEKYDLYRLMSDREVSEWIDEQSGENSNSYISVRITGQFKYFMGKDKVKEHLAKIINVTNKEKAQKILFKALETQALLNQKQEELSHEQGGIFITPQHKFILDLEHSKKDAKIANDEYYFINGRIQKTSHDILLLQVHNIYQMGNPNLQFIQALAHIHNS